MMMAHQMKTQESGLWRSVTGWRTAAGDPSKRPLQLDHTPVCGDGEDGGGVFVVVVVVKINTPRLGCFYCWTS